MIAQLRDMWLGLHVVLYFVFPSNRAKHQEQRIKKERGFINQTKVACGGQSSDIIALHCQPCQRPPLGVMLHVIVGTFRAEPSWSGQWINPNNQPFTQRLFFYWIGNWKNETPVLKAGHIPGFTSNRILYDRGLLCSCLPLFTEFIHSLWLQKSLEKAAYARRRGAWSFVKSETDLTAMQWESCCVPAYLLFFCFILLYYSPDVRGMHFL